MTVAQVFGTYFLFQPEGGFIKNSKHVDVILKLSFTYILRNNCCARLNTCIHFSRDNLCL